MPHKTAILPALFFSCFNFFPNILEVLMSQLKPSPGKSISKKSIFIFSTCTLLRNVAPIKFLFVMVLLISLAACGEVVTVTVVRGEKPLNGLEEKDRVMLEKIKKSKDKKIVDSGLNNVIERTPHYSIPEYLAKYPENSQMVSDYTVGPADVISITVYGEPDLTKGAIRISGKGFISFPLIGRLKVAGLTPTEIENHIVKKLAEKQYLLDAHVDVTVSNFNSKQYFVLGEVGSPGSHPIQAKERIMDALTKVGGVREEKASNNVMLIRTLNLDTPEEKKLVIDLNLTDLLKKGDQISNIYLHDRDVLYFRPVEQFYILGQVRGPGAYNMPEDELSLVEAIGMAGGFTRIASRNSTRIVRIEDGVEKIIYVKVDEITDAGKKVNDVVIKPEDIIVVPESFF